MSIDVEYAIKKDIRNNPIVREVDVQQKREFLRTIGLGGFIVAMLLFSVWQHVRMVDFRYKIEQLRVDRAEEQAINRQLKLNLETLRAPQLLEDRARRELRLVPPTSKDTLVIERAQANAPGRALVAQVR